VDQSEFQAKTVPGSKQVRFDYKNFQSSSNLKRQDKNILWDRYYGTNNPALIESGLSTLASNFTMDLERNNALRKTEKKRKSLHCCCKISCFIILFISFLLVIITVTFFLTKGKKYFGAL